MDTFLMRQIFSELFVNLAAGWFGAIVIIPYFLQFTGKKRLLILTVDLFFGMLFLLLALWLRTL